MSWMAKGVIGAVSQKAMIEKRYFNDKGEDFPGIILIRKISLPFKMRVRRRVPRRRYSLVGTLKSTFQNF